MLYQETITQAKAKDLYEFALDQDNGTITIGPLTYRPSQVLFRMDPIEYFKGLREFKEYLTFSLNYRITVDCMD